MADEVIRLVLETKGAETIERLEKSTEEYRTLLAMLTAEFARGEIEADKFLKTQSAWGAELNKETALLERLKSALAAQTAAAAVAETQTYELADAYDLVEKEMTQVVAMAPQVQRSFDWTTVVSPRVRQLAEDFDFATLQMGQGLNQVGMAAGKDGGFGRGLLQASFAIQDFTSSGGDLVRGLGAIQNNIPMILTGLGVGAGLAGVVSIVTVGVGLLVSNWSSVETLWKGSEAKNQAKKMEELAEATKIAADETARLKKNQGAGVDEQKGTVETAVKEVGFGQATADIKAALVRRGESFGEEADKAMAEGLLRNATQGHKGALAMLNEMFVGSGAGAASEFGQALADPGGKKAMAEAKAANQRKAQENRKLEEQRAKEQADAEKIDEQSRALIAQFEDPALGDKALAEQKNSPAAKAQDKLLADQVKDAKAATDAREKALRETSLDEESAAEAARLRGTGMSPEQQQEMLRRQIGQRVNAALPGVGAMEQGALTNRFAEGANQQVADQMAGLMSQGMGQQQAALAVAAETQAIVAQLLAKQRGIGNAIGQLRQNNQNLRRQVEMPGNWNGNPMGGD